MKIPSMVTASASGPMAAAPGPIPGNQIPFIPGANAHAFAPPLPYQYHPDSSTVHAVYPSPKFSLHIPSIRPGPKHWSLRCIATPIIRHSNHCSQCFTCQVLRTVWNQQKWRAWGEVGKTRIPSRRLECWTTWWEGLAWNCGLYNVGLGVFSCRSPPFHCSHEITRYLSQCLEDVAPSDHIKLSLP